MTRSDHLPNLTIERAQSWIVQIPTSRRHIMSVDTLQSRRLVILKLTASNGMTGFGETTTVGDFTYSDENADTIKYVLDKHLLPGIIGKLIARPALVLREIRSNIVGNYFAKNALEMALYDLLGKATNLPLSEFFGGRLRWSVPVGWTLASGDTQFDIEEAKTKLDAQQHNIFKIKVGRQSWRDDLSHVAAIADAIGDRSRLTVDVNQAWDLMTAKQMIPALSEVGVDMIEQPIIGSDLIGASELRGLGAAIMADEALRGGVPPAVNIAAARAADILSLKIAQAGGLTACRNVAQIGLGAGLSLYGGTMLEAGIGTIASAQLFSTLPDISWGTELFGPLLMTEDYLRTPLRYENFELHIPDGPGLGLDIDEGRVEDLSEKLD